MPFVQPAPVKRCVTGYTTPQRTVGLRLLFCFQSQIEHTLGGVEVRLAGAELDGGGGVAGQYNLVPPDEYLASVVQKRLVAARLPIPAVTAVVVAPGAVGLGRWVIAVVSIRSCSSIHSRSSESRRS